MQIGIGLPNTLTVPGPMVVEWARRAEERGFASLATIDRIVYPSFDSLTSLGVAAGATSRIELCTNILLTPLYPPVWLAKASASLDAMSGGRLTLGLAVGGRGDDFQAMRVPLNRRGAIMDSTLDLLTRSWAGENVTGDDFPVGPPPERGNRVRVLIGGSGPVSVRRTVAYGDGWTAGGAGPAALAPAAASVRDAWKTAGRDGEPRISALAYFGLGDEDASRASLRTYYGFLGQWVDTIVDSGLRSPAAVKAAVRAFEDAGATELVFNPTVADLAEVDRLADTVL